MNINFFKYDKNKEEHKECATCKDICSLYKLRTRIKKYEKFKPLCKVFHN